MTLIHEYDNNYFYTKNSRILDKKGDVIPDNYTDAVMPNGLLKAKFSGGEWIEGATEKELQQAKDKAAQYIESTKTQSLEYVKKELNDKIDILNKKIENLENIIANIKQ